MREDQVQATTKVTFLTILLDALFSWDKYLNVSIFSCCRSSIKLMNMTPENTAWVCALLCISQVLSAPLKCQLEGNLIQTSYNLLKDMVHLKHSFEYPLLSTPMCEKDVLLILCPSSILGGHFPKTMHQGECCHNFSNVRFCVQWNRRGKCALSNLQPSPEAEGRNLSDLSPPGPRSLIMIIPFPHHNRTTASGLPFIKLCTASTSCLKTTTCRQGGMK